MRSANRHWLVDDNYLRSTALFFPVVPILTGGGAAIRLGCHVPAVAWDAQTFNEIEHVAPLRAKGACAMPVNAGADGASNTALDGGGTVD